MGHVIPHQSNAMNISHQTNAGLNYKLLPRQAGSTNTPPDQTLKTQPTPINNCQNFLNLMNIPIQIEPTIPDTNRY